MLSTTLEAVEESFRKWRAQRSSGAEPIPEHLWIMAVELYPQHKRSKICQRLRLGGGQFKQRLENSATFCAGNDFIVASRDAVKAEPVPDRNIQLRIQGKERALTFHVGVHDLAQILPHVSALL
jgi:hypothetical protein